LQIVDEAILNNIIKFKCDAPENILIVSASLTSGSTLPPLEREAIRISRVMSSFKRESKCAYVSRLILNARVNSARESESCGNTIPACQPDRGLSAAYIHPTSLATRQSSDECEVAHPIGRLLVDDECGSVGLTLQIERSTQQPQRLPFAQTCVGIIPLGARRRGGPLRHLCGSTRHVPGGQTTA
jgi:hypothetical protein